MLKNVTAVLVDIGETKTMTNTWSKTKTKTCRKTRILESVRECQKMSKNIGEWPTAPES